MSAVETAPALHLDMPHEVEQLRGTIAEQLKCAGAQLTDDRLESITEIVLADAIALALRWIEER